MKKLVIDIKRWLKYWKVIRNTYDFDYESILEVEKHQLTQLRNCIAKFKSSMSWKDDDRRMKLALKLLNIALEQDNFLLFNNSGYKLNVYVNTKNYSRFIKYSENFKNIDSDLFKDTLRVEKAWYLYNKLRYYWLKSWWD